MTDDETNPFLDNEPGENELTCWKDGARFCADDCVAYEDKCEGDPRFSPCLLLNIKRAKAKSFANIAQELKKLNEAVSRVDDKAVESLAKRREAESYAQKIKEMDPGPPEIK